MENLDQFKNIPQWGKYIKETGKGYEVDVSGYVISQYLSEDIPRENIEVYVVDTYQAASEGKSFSHKYATVKNDPKLDGRFLVGVSLKE